jgi:four helix bundle protein
MKLFRHLRESKVERELCSQLLKSGTSIGANIEEAIGASSRKDFIAKLAIAYREARESNYWLRLLKEDGLLDQKLAESFLADCTELQKILSAIINSSKLTPNS